VVDFNLDGKLDLVVVNRRSKAQVWRNTSPTLGHWLEFKLEQAGTNRDAIGAWIEVKHAGHILRREITSGGGHASGENGWWHFGVGDDSKTEVRVVWPDGNKDEWQMLEADHFYTLRSKAPAQVFKSK
jgi:enediyne biosynthesis protein E4